MVPVPSPKSPSERHPLGAWFNAATTQRDQPFGWVKTPNGTRFAFWGASLQMTDTGGGNNLSRAPFRCWYESETH